MIGQRRSQEDFIELPHLWNLESEAVQALFTSSQLKTAKLNADHQKTYQVINLPQSSPQARNEMQVFRISVCTYIGTLLHNVASIKHAKKAPEIYPPTHWSWAHNQNRALLFACGRGRRKNTSTGAIHCVSLVGLTHW